MEAALPQLPPWLPNGSRADVWTRLLHWLTSAATSSSTDNCTETQFEALIDRHRGALERLCFFRERDTTRRQDLWQDMLLALWKSLPSYRGDGSERAWVLRVAHNIAASHVAHAIRDRRVSGVLEPDEAVGDPDRDVEVRELMRRVRALDLASQQLVLLYLEGLTSSEIAEATGLGQSNVTTRLSRIRQRLSEARP